MSLTAISFKDRLPFVPRSTQLSTLNEARAFLFSVTVWLRFIEPQLASPSYQPPEGKHWSHDIKQNGMGPTPCYAGGSTTVSRSPVGLSPLPVIGTSGANFRSPTRTTHSVWRGTVTEEPTMHLNKWFTHVAEAVSHATGHAVAFIICCVIVIIWAVTGPVFGFSDTWQLIINTGTTIVTFLMVFLIQNTQNRDGAAIQAKLDELILVTAAENSFIGIEHLTEEEVNAFRRKCKSAAARAKREGRSAVKRTRTNARKAAEEAA